MISTLYGSSSGKVSGIVNLSVGATMIIMIILNAYRFGMSWYRFTSFYEDEEEESYLDVYQDHLKYSSSEDGSSFEVAFDDSDSLSSFTDMFSVIQVLMYIQIAVVIGSLYFVYVVHTGVVSLNASAGKSTVVASLVKLSAKRVIIICAVAAFITVIEVVYFALQNDNVWLDAQADGECDTPGPCESFWGSDDVDDGPGGSTAVKIAWGPSTAWYLGVLMAIIQCGVPVPIVLYTMQKLDSTGQGGASGATSYDVTSPPRVTQTAPVEEIESPPAYTEKPAPARAPVRTAPAPTSSAPKPTPGPKPTPVNRPTPPARGPPPPSRM